MRPGPFAVKLFVHVQSVTDNAEKLGKSTAVHFPLTLRDRPDVAIFFKPYKFGHRHRNGGLIEFMADDSGGQCFIISDFSIPIILHPRDRGM